MKKGTKCSHDNYLFKKLKLEVCGNNDYPICYMIYVRTM